MLSSGMHSELQLIASWMRFDSRIPYRTEVDSLLNNFVHSFFSIELLGEHTQRTIERSFSVSTLRLSHFVHQDSSQSFFTKFCERLFKTEKEGKACP